MIVYRSDVGSDSNSGSGSGSGSGLDPSRWLCSVGDSHMPDVMSHVFRVVCLESALCC